MLELRPYQRQALEAVLAELSERDEALLQAGTGSGKTLIFSSVIKSYMSRYPAMRVLILAHQEELVRQAYDKLLKTWPEGEGKVGMACSGVGKADTSRPVTIGSRQTLARRLPQLQRTHLVVVDEAHHLPPENNGGQYSAIMSRLRDLGRTKLLGVTATPYRLGQGYIYGADCKAPEENWFGRLCYSAGIGLLQEQGYLCGLEIMAAGVPDLSAVRIMGTGDYDLSALSTVMSEDVQLGSAVKAVEEHAADRRHIVVFCVSIEHAEKMREAFSKAGHAVGIVHSEMRPEDRRAALDAFEKGEIRILVNVMVLTEGWDSTAIDCIVLCRPTQAPALYVQMVGRGLRLHPGKTDCLLLDLSGNVARHGDPRNPLVTWTHPRGWKDPAESEDVVTAEGVVCCACGRLNPMKAIMCGWCGKELRRVRNDLPDLRRVVFEEPAFPCRMKLHRWYFNPAFVSAKGNAMMRVDATCVTDGGAYYFPTAYMDFEGNSGQMMRRRAEAWWRSVAGTECPRTLEDVAERLDEVRKPSRVTVSRSEGRDGKIFYNVTRWS